MRIPVPTERLVTLALVGALLTAVVSVGLASPGLFPGSNPADGDGNASARLAPDAPSPNADFTPAVRTASSDEDEHEADEDDDHEDAAEADEPHEEDREGDDPEDDESHEDEEADR